VPDNKVRLDDEMAKHWFGLPLHLRKRWWDETEYGKKPPSDELKAAVQAAIEEKSRAG
jgi:hypothetical protein